MRIIGPTYQVYKNIARNRELEGDVLRQRRDLYATSLGLILFHLAGARLRDDAVLTTVPVHLTKPSVLYWAVWAALFYFLFRYWMVAPPAIARFKDEWRIQTLASKKYRQLVANYAARSIRVNDERKRALNLISSGSIPDYADGDPPIRWNDFKNLKNSANPTIAGIRGDTVPFIESERDDLCAAKRRGFVRAIFLERTATDVIAPYILALLAVIVAFFW